MSSISRFRVQECQRIPAANIFALVIEHTVIVCHYENEIQLVVEEIRDCEEITEPVYFVETQSIPETVEFIVPKDRAIGESTGVPDCGIDPETEVTSKVIIEKDQSLSSGLSRDDTNRLSCVECLRSYTLTVGEVDQALRKLEKHRRSSTVHQHSEQARVMD